MHMDTTTITRSLTLDCDGVETETACEIEFHYWPGEPWTYHHPGAPAEAEIVSLRTLDGIDLLDRLPAEEVRKVERMIEERA